MSTKTLSGHRYWYARRINVNGRLISPDVANDDHGTTNAYDYYGCRCDLCGRAKKDHVPARRVKHRTTVPEPPPEPEQRRAPVRPRREEIPSMTHTAVDGIHDHERLTTVLAAYYRPDVCMPAGQDGYERRMAGDVSIVVANGVVVSVDERECVTGEPESLTPVHVPKRRKRGPAGNRTPTTWPEVISRARDAGCIITDGSRHLKVTLPDGNVMTLPKTSSDYRAIANAVRELSNKGVSVYRSLT